MALRMTPLLFDESAVPSVTEILSVSNLERPLSWMQCATIETLTLLFWVYFWGKYGSIKFFL